MKILRSPLLTRILLILGSALLLGAIVLFALTLILPPIRAEKAGELVETLHGLMPAVADGVPDVRSDPTMSTVEVDGENFCGIIEIPAYSRKLPVHADWDAGKVTHYPCRYTGSIYQDGLIIGGSDNNGQLDFMKQIANGDTVYFTDMTGLRCSYTVTSILRTDDVSTSNLTDSEADLTLFVRNSYGLDYIVVRCEIKSADQ